MRGHEKKAGFPSSPGSPSRRRRCYSRIPEFGRKISAADGELADDLVAAVSDGSVTEFRWEADPELGQDDRHRRTERAEVAVGDLERDAYPIRPRRPQQSLGAALRGPARQRPHQLGVQLPVAADEL